MNIDNFISRNCYRAIKNDIDMRQPFNYVKEYKSSDGSLMLHLDAHYIEQNIAEDIWNGNNYLVGISVDYNGKEYGGIGGACYTTDDYNLFDTWEKFKDWIDKQLRHFKGYETEEFGQMSLF